MGRDLVVRDAGDLSGRFLGINGTKWDFLLALAELIFPLDCAGFTRFSPGSSLFRSEARNIRLRRSFVASLVISVIFTILEEHRCSYLAEDLIAWDLSRRFLRINRKI